MSDRRQDLPANPIRGAIETARLSRRLLLGLLASTAGAAAAGAQTAQAGQKAFIGRDGLQSMLPILQGARQGGVSVRTEILVPILRPDDLLVLNLALRNLQVSRGPGPRQITLINPAEPGVLLAVHQPQTIFEQAFEDQANPTALYPPAPPFVADTRMAGPSRVAYQTPAGFTGLPFTLADLLGALTAWPMRLDINAQPVPADPLGVATLIDQDQIRNDLTAAATALKGHIANRQSPATAAALQRAGTRLANTLSAAARQGRTVTGADLDAAVASAVSTSLGAQGVSRSDRTAASSFVQAVAASRAIRVVGVATLAPVAPHPPAPDVTSLEVPYQLFQTPLATAGWTHATGTVTHDGQTELWHSRLGAQMNGTVVELDGEPLRALWTPGYNTSASPPAPPWLASMAPSDRRMIVDLTANWNLKVTPRPSLARRLMLSALGATLELDGAWPVLPKGDDLQAWSHRAAIGRDFYVRLVYAGYLFPFGHAASFVQVTERKFVSQSSSPFASLPGGRAAVLVQRYFIIVREPSKSFPGPNQAYSGRDFPFQTVEIATKVTPNLAKPAPAPGIPDPGSFYGSGPSPTPIDPNPSKYHAGFWPIDLATNQDVPFHLVGVDEAGRRVPFAMPLFFLAVTKNNAADLATIATAYDEQPANASRIRTNMRGAKIQFAPQTVNGDANGDTNHSCGAMTFAGAAPSGPVRADRPQFYPRMAKADVTIAAIKALLGAAAQPSVSYPPIYLQNGFDGPNKGQVYLGVAAPAAVTTGATDKFGGLVSPGLVPSALSRTFGAVQGQTDALGNAAGAFASGKFDPADFLPDAKLLGVVPLKSVLNVIKDVAQAAGAVPQLTNVELPDKIVASYSLKQNNLQAVDPLFLPNATSTLTINAQVELARASPTTPKASVDATLTDFKVNLYSFIILHFTELTMSARSGQKTDVTPQLDPDDGVMFGGPLEFVNGLRDVIPMNGFSDPPGLSVTPSGITASYSLGLPTIGVGVLSLSNVSIGAGFDLPFTGEAPSARFSFATRQSPFNLTVSLFGGGGFFLIGVSTGGVQEIEASLEFGAQISIDLGVASGGVYVKGGFYFHWIGSTSEVDFEGYVEMGGHLSVLGLISVSLVFHLDLGFQKLPPSSHLYGEASLTVEVSVLFFSVSVSVDVKRTFAGSHSDPTFLDFAGSSKVWQDYCDAFA